MYSRFALFNKVVLNVIQKWEKRIRSAIASPWKLHTHEQKQFKKNPQKGDVNTNALQLYSAWIYCNFLLGFFVFRVCFTWGLFFLGFSLHHWLYNNSSQ